MNGWRRELQALAKAQKRTENNISKLVGAQARSEKRLAKVEAALQKLAQAQTRTEEAVETLTTRLERFERATEKRFEAVEKRLAKVEAALQKLTQAQTHTEEALEALTTRLETLTTRVGVLEPRVNQLIGSDLERRYRGRAAAYFAHIIRRAHVIEGDELVAFLDEAVNRGQLTQDEHDELLWTDMIVRGKLREDEREVYLVVEVSQIVDGHDVERAARRAKLLSQLKVLSIPVVAGTDITRKAMGMIPSLKVWQVIDGQTTPP